MKLKLWSGIAMGLLLSGATVIWAHEMGEEKGAGDVTMQGEVVDMACYMHSGEHGEKHKDCAQMCITNGMPMGLLTSKGDVVLLLEDHTNNEAYKSLKGMAAQQVTVTGDIHKRGGIEAITVEKAQKAS